VDLGAPYFQTNHFYPFLVVLRIMFFLPELPEQLVISKSKSGRELGDFTQQTWLG